MSLSTAETRRPARRRRTARTTRRPVAPARRPVIIHPLWVRLTHWINAITMVVMIMSGWRIYNASPLFGFTFPDQMTIGGWLGGALLWHFAAMWLLVFNGIVYVALGIASGRFRSRLLPIRAYDVYSSVRDALLFRLSHSDISKYNAAQKLLYAGVIVAGVLVVLSGLSIWKPVQFKYLTALFGGYEGGRIVHFAAMASIVGFLIVHVLLALIVPKSLRAIVTGR